MPRFRFLIRCRASLAVPLALACALPPGQAAWSLPGRLPQLVQADAEGEVGGFSQEALKAYVSAVLKVRAVDSAWRPRIAQAGSDEEAASLTREATDEMIGEIEALGLTLQQYNDITKAADRDSRLYDHIMTLLAQAH
ncbi:DUF4168 domain-containing protein [Pelagibius sp. CAU 1746]|uniref:DUF4168 domain-containing protein n=1 Tax=Pelagibius sp. CAU 1746 TaxID=3140370 RepID=UPI00325AD9A3